MAQQETADSLLAAREAEIQRLAERQEQAREVLVRALAEFDEVTNARDDAYERELVRRAEESSRARETVLAEMGFRRDAQGNLLPPEIAVAEGDVDLSLIEPAAGPSCLSDAERVMRPYLEDEVAAEWEHYLMGTVSFADAAARPADDVLTPIISCLEELSDNAAFYFRVIGHTDARGAPSLNQRLSLERAQAVRDIVAAKLPVQPWRLMAQGRGPDFPIADNDTPGGQAMNRRAEIFAIKTRL
jgi:outer membrane protein OmpA-like peptidoglycan-associated protein